MTILKKRKDFSPEAKHLFKCYWRIVLLISLSGIFLILFLRDFKKRVSAAVEVHTATACVLYEGQCTAVLDEHKTVSLSLNPSVSFGDEPVQVSVQSPDLDIQTGSLNFVILPSGHTEFNIPIFKAANGAFEAKFSFSNTGMTSTNWLIVLHLVGFDNQEYAIPFHYELQADSQTLYRTAIE